MLDQLTPEQTARFPEFIKKWTDIGLSTAPADRPRAEAAIREIYRIAGLAPPEKIVWCGSPLSQGLTRAIILDKKLMGDIGASVRDSVGASVRASVRASVWDSVRASVWDSVGASVRASVRASVWDSVYGQHEAGWLSFYDFFRSTANLTDQTGKLSGLFELAQSSGWIIPHQKICWVSERHHVLVRDEQGRLHSLSGPACAFPDGWGIYAVHGVRVPSYVIEHPEQITVAKIDSEHNAEVRRVMIERYGQERYIVDSGAVVVQTLPDNFFLKGLQTARLLRKDRADDSPIVMIDVLNSSPEPDGHTKRYMLRVQPDAYDGRASRECLAAIASTWRNEDGSLYFKRPEDYQPQIET